VDPSLCYYHIVLLSHVSFPWYLSSWANGEPHPSGFKSQSVALPLWCVMFLVRLFFFFFVENLLNVVLVLFQIFVKLLLTIPVAPMTTVMTKHFMFHMRWISIVTFSYLNFGAGWYKKYAKQFPCESLPCIIHNYQPIRSFVISTVDTGSWNNKISILFTVLYLSENNLTHFRYDCGYVLGCVQ
jgi:hypothetical protein